jgi:hypothetical protein
VRFTALALFLVCLPAAAITVEDIAAPAGVGAAEPFLFAARDGVLLSWLEPVAGSDRVALRFARWRAGRWSAPRTIVERNDLVANWADFPSIVEDAKGVLFAHWLQKSGKGVYAYDVRMAISNDDGRTWGKGFLLNRDGREGEHGFVTLVPLPKGGVAATWLGAAEVMTLRYATIDTAGGIRSEVQLDDRTCECCATGMAVADGRPVIVYRDRSVEEVRDVAVVRQTAKGWTKPRLLRADGWKIAGCPVNGPQVDARGERVAAAWFTAAGEQARVYVAFSDDAGATFATPIVVDDGKPLGRVDVAMLERDGAVVTWLEQTARGAEVRARRVAWHGKPESSIKVADSSGARAAGVARVAAVGGDLFVAWTEQNATTKRVHVTRLRWLDER